MRIVFSALLLALVQLGPAQAHWSFSDDRTTLISEDDNSGAWFLNFDCARGQLIGSYSVLAAVAEAFGGGFKKPSADLSVRLEVAPKGKKPQSFAVVLNADDGSEYRLGGPDARTVLKLLESSPAFTADLRAGNNLTWKASFSEEGFSQLKDQIAAFCPAPHSAEVDPN